MPQQDNDSFTRAWQAMQAIKTIPKEGENNPTAVQNLDKSLNTIGSFLRALNGSITVGEQDELHMDVYANAIPVIFEFRQQLAKGNVDNNAIKNFCKNPHIRELYKIGEKNMNKTWLVNFFCTMVTALGAGLLTPGAIAHSGDLIGLGVAFAVIGLTIMLFNNLAAASPQEKAENTLCKVIQKDLLPMAEMTKSDFSALDSEVGAAPNPEVQMGEN